MREVLNSKYMPKPLYLYSPIIKTGPFYFTSGMIAIDIESNTFQKGGVASESKLILENLQRALIDFELSLEHLVSVKIYTTQLELFSEINKVWENFFANESVPPARTSLGVSALPLGASVEMEAVLYKSK